jgi:hypothetical protein
MSRECPAVVQSPNDRYSGNFQIFEQNLIIDEVTMNVVQVDDIGLQVFYILDKLSCCYLGRKSMPIEKTGMGQVG